MILPNIWNLYLVGLLWYKTLNQVI
jgi:hypothetical protein